MAPHEPLPRSAMFFAGLILLIPHRIGMSRVNYVIKCYNLPISRAGLLLYKFHNPIEVSLFIGNVLGVIIVYLIAERVGSSNTAEKDKNKAVLKWCMVGVCTAMLISSIFMLIVYISGDDYGHLNLFYFSLILITFFDGFTNAFAFGCNGANAALYALGIPTSGALVSVLHNICKFFSDFDRDHWDNFDYIVLRLQLLCNIITLLVTIILWALLKSDSDNDAHLTPAFPGSISKLFANGNDDHYGDWSPILLLAISLGTVYAFYPSIAPYSIIDYQYASVIELWILIISATPTIVVALLDFTADPSKPTTTHYGPGGLYVFAYESGTTGNVTNCASPKKGGIDADTKSGMYKNWSSSGPWWHLIWLCAIFYILCIQIFMTILHYPHSFLSSFFNNKYAIGFISVLFNSVREVMQACGFSGAGKQVTTTETLTQITCSLSHPRTEHDATCPRDQYKWDSSNPPEGSLDGTIASINKPITLFVMMFCVFTGDGYLQHYRRCCRDCWPTTGFTKCQSFRYWLVR